MSNKLDLILSLGTLKEASIDEFTNAYGDNIQELVVKNNGDVTLYRSILLDVITELYYRVRNGISMEKYDPEDTKIEDFKQILMNQTHLVMADFIDLSKESGFSW